MAKKGLDITFVHYGIRKEDMDLISVLCTEHQLEFEWVKEELLKEFHERKIRNQDMDEKTLEKIIEKALLKLRG
ncbi:hypothetical protein CHU92_07330 [Flavobacterium cyanobacteriorum]|uniref:Uncharacterized protein n=1 Tax=Flavobacterium cyanobacteriorum TaxID=2022802 RepID=A0A255Z8G6_9FLAO|nr:DNA modification system-associated small protein [Flavobacterium cyanobacteriorum]OYQ37847.1 hypothetical protein CHU92_07330 [Flavobacterium cyanobacteriorum]